MTPNRHDWWLGYCKAPYADRGRSITTGYDCWGLIIDVYRDAFGITVGDFGEVYPLGIDPGTAEGVALARERILAELPGWRDVAWEEGAVALFNVRQQPVHVGICTATRGVLLHAHGSTGVDLLDIRKSARSSLKWKDRFVGCYLPA